ncbi:MAG: hypothetical protein AAGG08_16305, partial [Actinomycetota bacterium]
MASGDNKRRGSSSGKRSTRVNPSTKRSSTSRPSRGGVRDQTPPEGRRQQSAVSVDAESNRQTEFIGLGLVGVGVLLGLAIYFGLAGVLGDGVEALFGWILGLGRFVVPIATVLVGVASSGVP